MQLRIATVASALALLLGLGVAAAAQSSILLQGGAGQRVTFGACDGSGACTLSGTGTDWTVNVLAQGSAAGSFASESYGSNFGVSVPGGPLYIPAGTKISTGGCCVTLDTAPTAPGLTSATAGVAVQYSSAQASSSLGAATVGVQAYAGEQDEVATGAALLQDLLTFTIPGATQATVTDLGVQLLIFGDVSAGAFGAGGMAADLSLGGGHGSPLASTDSAWNASPGTGVGGTGASGGLAQYRHRIVAAAAGLYPGRLRPEQYVR